MNKQWFPKILLVFIVMIGLVNVLAAQFYLYWRFLWLDMPMHFLGGVWIGFAVLWIYYLSGRFKDIPENRRYVLYVYSLAGAVAVVIGVFWELFEFSVDVFVSFNEFNGFQDTISDLVFATIGALFAAKYFIYKGYYLEHDCDPLNS